MTIAITIASKSTLNSKPTYTSQYESDFCRTMVRIKGTCVAFLGILSISYAWKYKGSGFKKISVSCFDTLSLSPNFKTVIECCGFCMVTPDCEGVRFNGTICQTLTNLMTCCGGNKTPQKAWVKNDIAKNLGSTGNSCKFNVHKTARFDRCHRSPFGYGGKGSVREYKEENTFLKIIHP